MTRLKDAFFGSWNRVLLTIFFAALLVRGIFILTLQDGFYFPDSTFYLEAAINLVHNGELGKAYNRPPGYPVFLAGIYIVFGESILAIRTVESVLGALLAVVTALLARRIGGDVVGALAGILWAIYPLGVFIAGLVYPTSVLTILLAFGLLFFLPDSGQKLSPKSVFLAGIVWGLAALTTPVVLATIGAIGLWIIYWGGVNRLQLVSALFLGSALIIVPWIVRDFYVYDRLVLVEPRMVEHLPRLDSSKTHVGEEKIRAILEHPRVFVQRYAREFIRFWKPYPERLAMDWPTVRESLHKADERIVKDTIFSQNDLVNGVNVLGTVPLFLFAIVGTVAMCLREERRRDLSLLCAIILSFAAVYSLYYAKMRYRIPIEPYILILSAYGLTQAWRMLAGREVKKFEVRSSRFDVKAG